MDINFTSMLDNNLKDNNYSASPKKGKKNWYPWKPKILMHKWTNVPVFSC